EKKYSQIRLGWHWHDEYKSEQFVELLDDNLFGTGQEYLIHAQYAPRQQKYEITLKADRFFSSYFTYKIKTYYHLLQRYFFDGNGHSIGDIRENRRGIEFMLGQQIARFGTVTGEIRWEDIETKSYPDGSYAKIKLRTATIRSQVETINKYPFPTEGKKHSFYLEFATDLLGGETRYTKGFSSVESYIPITDNINLHPKFSIGWTETDT
ncbi:MAG: BamA/TamA family outer membrane protein, partial [candidate division Zixibacteria bacterium]|nr:BamA/TamA family outer membrane protein [candidate division Zixibacteria bacterium]